MRQEKPYDFQKKLLNPHPARRLKTEIIPSADEVALKDGFCIELSEDSGTVAWTAARDFAEYLQTVMKLSGVSLKSGLSSATAQKLKIHSLQEADASVLQDANQYRGYGIFVNDGVDIYGYDERGIAQALYYLENLMNMKRAPVLKRGVERRYPMFSPQMVHSGYALDEYPDEYLSYIAHEGRDAILIFTKAVNTVSNGYLNFNTLIRRAAKYGIDVYAYSYLESDKHPSDPDAQEYYDRSYGRLFRECPGLKGVVLVGESVEFPSRDPHVAKGRYFEIDKDGIPSGKVSAGWYPCEDYPEWLRMLQRVITPYRSDADIVFWTYNWGYQPEDARVKLIRSLPEGISLLVTFEMFEPKHFGGSQVHCADYTLSFEGPGGYFKSEAEAAKERGIKLYAMANTGGLTWDIGVIPYEPMPYQWIRRYEALIQAKKEWNLCGLMENHHYGFYPSFISKIAQLSFTEPQESPVLVAKRVICGEFGEENFSVVNDALKRWSEAIRHYTPSSSDQYGAFRIGPSYPFCLDKTVPVPSSAEAMFGNRICCPTYPEKIDPRDSLLSLRLMDEIRSLERMRQLLEEGTSLLEQCPLPNEKTEELLCLGRFILHTTVTGIHAKRWHRLKCRFSAAESREEAEQLLNEMEALLQKERANAQQTIPLVEADSRLGWEPSMLYMTDRSHLEWKIRQVDSVLKIELPNALKSLQN